MGDFTENAVEGTTELLRLHVRYPPGHHRYAFSGRKPQLFGDKAPMPREIAELLAWNLRRQGATVTLEPVEGQLNLFG